jgi:alkylation response protein AidB-like acyl-CoA dehydrogenase
MNFDYTEEQQQLADSLRRYLANEYAFDRRKAIIASPEGVSDTAWAAFAELGLTAITLPESDGGFGGGAVDLMAPMEACGEALVVEPLIETIGLGARLVARAGSPAQRERLLRGVAEGSVRLAFASLEPGRRYQLDPQTTTARVDNGAWLLEGEKTVVIGAPSAHCLIVSARTAAGVSLFLVPAGTAGLSLSPCRTVDGQRAADVRLSGVRLPADALLGADGAALPHIEEAVDFATALLCADAVGAMKQATDATLEYTRNRKQFGVPISSFQVLQHRMVEMYIGCEQARSMAILAAARVDSASDATERKRAVSMAKVKIADAARQISQESVQLHGGMGMTEEMKVSHTFRRLTMIAQRFGDADHHLERYAALG